MTILDSKNVKYEVLYEIGEGSQGKTFLLKDTRFVVKLFNRKINEGQQSSMINFLQNLDLDKRIFAVPLRKVIEPKSGYIAEFASGMEPLSALTEFPKNQNFASWFASTGGLKRRYEILLELARILRSLHGKGLAYCDLSVSNIFISKDRNKNNVFLIDLDNLRYKSSILNNIYTPFYGAPEVITNTAPNTVMSDCYSFAVIAYELLTMNHPLIGDLVSQGEPELEEKALEGEMAWVDNKDGTNSRSTGIPTFQVITVKLYQLFRQNFEEGLKNPMKRPSMAAWYEASNQALNELLNCRNPDCGNQYPFNNINKCSFCGAVPNHLIKIQIRRWEENSTYSTKENEVVTSFQLDPAVLEELLIDENTSKEINSLDLLISKRKNIDPLEPLLKIKSVLKDGDRKIIIEPLKNFTYKISPRTGPISGKEPITRETSVRLKIIQTDEMDDSKKYMIHTEDLSVSQRVITID